MAARRVGKNLRTRLPSIRSPYTTYFDVVDAEYFETLGVGFLITSMIIKCSVSVDIRAMALACESYAFVIH